MEVKGFTAALTEQLLARHYIGGHPRATCVLINLSAARDSYTCACCHGYGLLAGKLCPSSLSLGLVFWFTPESLLYSVRLFFNDLGFLVFCQNFSF
jgi:hypothetical protein